MSRFVYRCSKCRARNTFSRAITNWTQPRGLPRLSVKEVNKVLREIGGKRCRSCRHTSFYPDKERITREPCRCDGAYHWGPHRPGSPMCLLNPNVNVFRAYRSGLDDDDIAWHGLSPVPVPAGVDCPF